MNNKYNIFETELNKLKEANQFRQIRKINKKEGKHITVNDKRYINLSSNNYLGIGNCQDIQAEFLTYIQQDQHSAVDLGSTSSRLLTGNHPEFEKLETHLNHLYKSKSALIFNSGYHANIGVISSLLGRDDIILSDKLNHASIIDGMKLSGASFFRYKHLDYKHLETLLKKQRSKYKKALIITESIFSMDGDTADLKKIIDLAQQYDALTMVDEAHAFGVLGSNGGGLSEQQDVISEIDIIVGTFGKAIGGSGAFAACPPVLKDYFINHARSLIFTTALPAINIAWVNWVLTQKQELLKQRRLELSTLTSHFRSEVIESGLATLGDTQIIPILIGDNEKTVKLASKLQDRGYWALPIRPPTVPKGSSRLRLSLNADIHWDELAPIPHLLAEELS